MNDKQIINRILEGDERGMNALYEKATPMITKMIIKNSGTTAEARDIVQDVAIIFWRKLTEDNLILSCKISTYLYSVAWNLWRKELNRKKKFSDEEVDILVDEEFSFEIQEQIDIVRDSIEDLSPSCQLVLTEHLSGTPMCDIAEKCGYKNSDVAKTAKYKCQLQLEDVIRSKYSEFDVKDY